MYFGKILAVQGNHIYSSLPTYTRTDNASAGLVLDYRAPLNTKLWERKRNQREIVDLAHFKGVMLYDKDKKRVDEYLDYIDPIQGKIAGLADIELSYKTTYDPSVQLCC